MEDESYSVRRTIASSALFHYAPLICESQSWKYQNPFGS